LALSDVGLSDVGLSDLGLSDLGSPEILPKRAGAATPNRIAFMVNVPRPISRLNAYAAERRGSYWFQ
jgi:hypothetical protein